MTWKEFVPELNKLLAKFPNFKPESKADLARAYFEDLARFSLPVLRAATRDVLEASEKRFPSAPELRLACESRELAMLQKQQLRPKFEPLDHGCNLGAQIKVTFEGARKLLARFDAYEAVHVECAGTPHPVCPRCGTCQPPFRNPVIDKLMEMPEYKNQTAGWNPYHKGLLLCAKCEQPGRRRAGKPAAEERGPTEAL